MNGIGSHQSARMLNDEWLTPPNIIINLGPFDLDPCAPVIRPWNTAIKHCQKCASTCAGCMEMAVNLGYAELEEVIHLIDKPDMLSKKYRDKFNNHHHETRNSRTDKNRTQTL